MVMFPDVCACAYVSNLFQRQRRASLHLYLTCNVYVHLVIIVKSIVFKFDVALIRSASAYIVVARALAKIWISGSISSKGFLNL